MKNISSIYSHIRAHHKMIPPEYLFSRTPEELLALTHPLQRGDYIQEFKANGWISSKTTSRYQTGIRRPLIINQDEN